MATQNKKYNIKLNNLDKIEQLLQETYDLACRQSNQIQEEINKITNTTVVNDLDIDGKEKNGKIINNYISLLQKSTAQKMDIAKLLTEVVKHNGDVKGAIDDSKKIATTLDFSKLRDLAKNVNTNEESEQYQLKK